MALFLVFSYLCGLIIGMPKGCPLRRLKQSIWSQHAKPALGRFELCDWLFELAKRAESFEQKEHGGSIPPTKFSWQLPNPVLASWNQIRLSQTAMDDILNNNNNNWVSHLIYFPLFSIIIHIVRVKLNFQFLGRHYNNIVCIGWRLEISEFWNKKAGSKPAWSVISNYQKRISWILIILV